MADIQELKMEVSKFFIFKSKMTSNDKIYINNDRLVLIQK